MKLKKYETQEKKRSFEHYEGVSSMTAEDIQEEVKKLSDFLRSTRIERSLFLDEFHEMIIRETNRGRYRD